MDFYGYMVMCQGEPVLIGPRVLGRQKKESRKANVGSIFPPRGENTEEPGSCMTCVETRYPDAQMAEPGSSREVRLGFDKDPTGDRRER